MTVNYVDGDLFTLLPKTNEPKYVPHVVNNIGRMGSGFALAAMTHYPVVREDYLRWFEATELSHELKNPFQLGKTQFVVVQATPTIVICNMVAQSGLIGSNNPKPIKYAALLQCMTQVAENIRICCGTAASIHAPMFGSALAGGKWELIQELIEECWRDFPV